MSDAALHAIADHLDDGALRATIRHRVEAAGTSFYWAMRLLPPDRRYGMYAVSLFTRGRRDIADGAAGAAQARRSPAGAAVDCGGRATLWRAPQRSAAALWIAPRGFSAVIDGMEMDA
jgi:phytoene synthase